MPEDHWHSANCPRCDLDFACVVECTPDTLACGRCGRGRQGVCDCTEYWLDENAPFPARWLVNHRCSDGKVRRHRELGKCQPGAVDPFDYTLSFKDDRE